MMDKKQAVEIRGALDKLTIQRFKSLRRNLRILKQDKNAMIGFLVIVVIVLVAIFAPWLAPYDYSEQHISSSFRGPTSTYWLGTDEFGRDLLSRIIWGTRPALIVGVLSIIVAIGIGVPIGILAGYKLGWIDRTVTWAVDIMLSFSPLLFGLMIIIALGPGTSNLAFAIGLANVAQFIRLSRGPTMALRDNDFIRAARALGASDLRILFSHMLPNVIGPIIIMGTLSMAGAIRTEASLSFLGYGIQPPLPSWGNLIRQGVEQILQSRWMALFSGLALTVTVLAFNMVGDSLRDMLDPRELLTKARGKLDAF